MTRFFRSRALVLLSGGLDSQLAAYLLREQEVEVHALTFISPFFGDAAAHAAARALDLPFRSVDFTPSLVRILETHSTVDDLASDPTLDCHAEMVRIGAEYMREMECDFLATGEVLGQRASTQSMECLRHVAERSRCADRVLRPLSARLLSPTRPEREGRVDRERMLEIEGGNRDEQRRLATRYGLQEQGETASCSRLCDPVLKARLQDLRAHEGLQGQRALGLLRIGRHFRLGPVTKLVIGRNEAENAELEGNAELYELVLKLEDVHGPTGLLPVFATEDQVRLAAGICARYSDAEPAAETRVRVRSSRGTRVLSIRAQTPDEVNLHRIR